MVVCSNDATVAQVVIGIVDCKISLEASNVIQKGTCTTYLGRCAPAFRETLPLAGHQGACQFGGPLDPQLRRHCNWAARGYRGT